MVRHIKGTAEELPNGYLVSQMSQLVCLRHNALLMLVEVDFLTVAEKMMRAVEDVQTGTPAKIQVAVMEDALKTVLPKHNALLMLVAQDLVMDVEERLVVAVAQPDRPATTPGAVTGDANQHQLAPILAAIGQMVNAEQVRAVIRKGNRPETAA